MATLAEIAVSIKDRISQSSGANLLTSGNKADKSILSKMKSVMKDLGLKSNPNGGWRELKRTFSITTIADTDNYDLPSDLSRLVRDTDWNKSSSIKMRNSSAVEWSEFKNSLLQVNVGLNLAWRLKGKKIYIDPIPEAGTELEIEYISDYMWTSADGLTYKKFPTLETDIFLLDDELLVRGIHYKYNAGEGIDFSFEQKEYDDLLEILLSNDAGLGSFSMNERRGRGWNIPDGSWSIS